MNPAVMLSIRPEWCEKILNGKQTVAVCKTFPHDHMPFKCYIYCTKPKKRHKSIGGFYGFEDELYRKPNGEIKCGDSTELVLCKNISENNFLSGMVVGEFVCDRFDNLFRNSRFWLEEWEKPTCMTAKELLKYSKGSESLYAWHISDLKIYDKPKELSLFKRNTTRRVYNRQSGRFETTHFNGEVHEPPKSWCYVEELEDQKE